MMTSRAARRAGPAEGLSREQFDRLRRLIERRCGLRFDESQYPSLTTAVQVRMCDLDLHLVDDYCGRLECRPADEEFRNLINLVTITSTSFFRDAAQFRLFRYHVLPTLIAAHTAAGRRILRIWSAGCSSGEEAYSIALMLRDLDVYRTHPDWTFEIVGTDLNTDALERARRGVYSARSLRNVEGEWLRRYFKADGSHFRLNDEVRRSVRFEYGNLTAADPPLSWAGTRDVVFCKNVTIYFQPESTRRLIRGFHHILADGGYLLLGHSETLWQIADGFELIRHEGAFCYRKGPLADVSYCPPPTPAGGARRVALGSKDAPSPRVNAAPEPGDRAPGVSGDAHAGQYGRCLASFRAAEWTVAEARLLDVVRAAPTFVPALLLLAGVYLHTGRDDEAVRQAGQVLRLNDLDARAHLLLGIVAARQGLVDDALQALRRVLYLDDSLALAHFWTGNLHRDRGDVVRACREYENLLHHWERGTLDLTEEFALGMSADELVDFCTRSVEGFGPAK